MITLNARPTPKRLLAALDAMRAMPGGPSQALTVEPIIIGAALLDQGLRDGWAYYGADNYVRFKRVSGLPLALWAHAEEP